MYDVGVSFDLYKVGINEDGRDQISHRYFVQIEAPDGSRWVHRETFDGSRADFDDEHGIPFFHDLLAEAEGKADDLANRVRAHLAKGGDLNFSHWVEDYPRYGSAAYTPEHEADKARRERQYDY